MQSPTVGGMLWSGPAAPAEPGGPIRTFPNMNGFRGQSLIRSPRPAMLALHQTSKRIDP